MRSSLLSIILLSLAAGSIGCGPAVFSSTRFDAYGEYDASRTSAPIVATPQDVRVFYGTGPDGFSLRENELKAEPGFGHRILGTVKLVDIDGACAINDYAPSETGLTPASLTFDKKHVVTELRTKAREAGGNAIIYVHSEVPDVADGQQTCAAVKRGEALGSAWVVVLGAAPAAAPAGEAAAPTAPAAPGLPVVD